MTLAESMKIALADTFALYLKTHNFHFNVVGKDFYQYHKFLNDLYDELWEAFDAVGEQIRTLDVFTPASFTRYSELTTIADATTVPSGVQMMKILHDDNERVIKSLTTAYKKAEEAKNLGLSNFLQDRIDKHNKHGWMLRVMNEDH